MNPEGMGSTMIKAFVSTWKNIFNYTGKATIREYWLGLLGSLIAMYLSIIPLAGLVFLSGFPSSSGILMPLAICSVLFLLPTASLTVRRIRDSGFNMSVMIASAILIPVFGMIAVGLLKKNESAKPLHPITTTGRTLILIGLGAYLWCPAIMMVSGLSSRRFPYSPCPV